MTMTGDLRLPSPDSSKKHQSTDAPAVAESTKTKHPANRYAVLADEDEDDKAPMKEDNPDPDPNKNPPAVPSLQQDKPEQEKGETASSTQKFDHPMRLQLLCNTKTATKFPGEIIIPIIVEEILKVPGQHSIVGPEDSTPVKSLAELPTGDLFHQFFPTNTSKRQGCPELTILFRVNTSVAFTTMRNRLQTVLAKRLKNATVSIYKHPFREMRFSTIGHMLGVPTFFLSATQYENELREYLEMKLQQRLPFFRVQTRTRQVGDTETNIYSIDCAASDAKTLSAVFGNWP